MDVACLPMYENIDGSEEKKKNCFVNVTLRENQKIICKFSSNAQTILIKQSVPFYFKSPLKPSNACQL